MAMKKICIAGIATAAAAASVPVVAHADGVFGFSSSSSSSGSNSDFNPETLERAAKALREINKSKNAKNVFEVMRQQEETRQLELEVQRLHQELMETRRDMERQRAIFEEQRKMYQTRAQEKAQNLRGEDDLARKRMQHDIETQKRQDRELVKMQEESSFRQEQMKRKTEEQIQAQLRQTEKERAQFERETLRVKAMAEAEGRVREAKLSEDVNRRILLERVNAEREKWLSAINTTFEHIGDGVNALLTDRNKLLIAVGGATALAAGVYTTREGSRVMWGYVDRILGQPTLLRESSRGKYPWSGLLSRSISTKSKVTDSTALKGTTSNGNGNGFGEVILHPSLKKRIEHLAKATANTKSHKAPFRNMLFFGPPGTGKTMAARELAQKSGLEYAMMTGGDVVPLGSQAVTKIHQLFDWAGKSKKGLLLFIDEADAFLCERNSTQMSEAQRSALNALLFRTGDQSRDIVLVCATNRPGDLDAAVTDRIDEILEFPLPGEEERFKLLKLYFNKYIVESGEKKTGLRALFDSKQQKIEVKDFSDDILWEAAKKTEGLSGREIAKMMAGVQAAVYGSKDCVLDANLFREVVDYKISEHHQRRKLAEGET